MPDKRGVLDQSELAELRRLRVGELWERTDTIAIGEGASDAAPGWFETWAAFAAASANEFVWFNGRGTSAPKALVNQLTERTDWAQTIEQTLIEFVAPPGQSDIESDPNDGFFSPQMFVSILPQFMPFRLRLAESDDMTLSPGSHFPSGFGTSYASTDGAAAPSAIPGAQGEPVITQGWHWREPITLAAKANIAMIAMINDPLRTFLAGLPGPGSKLVPDGDGGVIELPNWYFIRITMRGPRYLQLRGARSSA